MRSKSKVQVAAMAALVAAVVVVVGAGQAGADVQKYPGDDWGRGSNGSSGPNILLKKKPGHGLVSLGGSLRNLFGRYFDTDGVAGGSGLDAMPRMPVVRGPRVN